MAADLLVIIKVGLALAIPDQAECFHRKNSRTHRTVHLAECPPGRSPRMGRGARLVERRSLRLWYALRHCVRQ